MTGYGKATAEYQGKKITAEIRSLNSKALDLSARLAPAYREKELEIRGIIASTLERGKVEFNLWVEQSEGVADLPVNADLIEAYHQKILLLCRQYDIPEPADWMTCLLRMPDVMSRMTDTPELTAEEWLVAREVVLRAVEQLMEFRRQEGNALQRKFCEKLDNIALLLEQIEPFEKERTVKIKQRLLDALRSIPEVEYDRNRLEQEMIYYLEKLDISEEKQRLANHLKYFRQTMEEGHGQGKKLGFIAQEMGREINTTGSKSNQAEMQNIVVRMKDELEQIKEQVLNVM